MNIEPTLFIDNVQIAADPIKLKKITTDAVDEYIRIYGDLGDRYLEMVKTHYQPEGLVSAFEILIEANKNTINNLDMLTSKVNEAKPDSAFILHKVVFEYKTDALSYLRKLKNVAEALKPIYENKLLEMKTYLEQSK